MTPAKKAGVMLGKVKMSLAGDITMFQGNNHSNFMFPHFHPILLIVQYQLLLFHL